MCVELSINARAMEEVLHPLDQNDLMQCLEDLLYAPPELTVRYQDPYGGPDFDVSMLEVAYVAVWRHMTETELKDYNRRTGKRCEEAIVVGDLIDGLDYPGSSIPRRLP